MKHKLPFKYIDYLTRSVFKTGSSYTCFPPVLHTDEDYLVLVHALAEAGEVLQEHGWTNCFDEWAKNEATNPSDMDGYSVEDAYGALFQAWRYGKLNVIITDDETLYLRSVGATLVAKHINLKQKADRVALFRAIKYGEEYLGELP